MKVRKVERTIRVVSLWDRHPRKVEKNLTLRGKSKISVFVLNRLGGSNLYGRETKLPEEFSSNIMKNVLFSLSKQMRNAKETRLSGLETKRKKEELFAPIGLRYFGGCLWLNAAMQFLIHLPKFVELSCFIGKLFTSVRVFVDQYIMDQKLGLKVSLGNSSSLLPSLLKMDEFDFHHLSNTVNFYRFFQSFFTSVFPCTVFDKGVCFPRLFMVLGNKDLIENVLASHPSEVIVAFTRDRFCKPERQYFLDRGGCFYDLDSFIECRFEGQWVYYIAYIRIGSQWYQCEDEKVCLISSAVLSIPLSRGVVFHYKRIGV